MTTLGFIFWKKIFSQNRDKFNFYILDSVVKSKTRITAVEQMDDVFSSSERDHYKRFLVTQNRNLFSGKPK